MYYSANSKKQFSKNSKGKYLFLSLIKCLIIIITLYNFKGFCYSKSSSELN